MIIDLSEAAKLTLERLSYQTGRSQAEIVQEAIESYLIHACKDKDNNQSLPSCVGMGASGKGNLSEQNEELLWQDTQES
jgi:hypothetical protein